MAVVDNLVSMDIFAAAWLLRLQNNALVRASTRAAVQRLDALLR